MAFGPGASIQGATAVFFNASLVSEKYRDGISEVRPLNVAAFYYIKATTGFVPDNPTDLQAVLAEMQQTASNLQTAINEIQQIKEDLLGADYVIESWQSANGNMWYRKYKSGWIEQGGRAESVPRAGTIITLPTPMLNTNFQIMATADWDIIRNEICLMAAVLSPANIRLRLGSYRNGQPNWPVWWVVRGYAA